MVACIHPISVHRAQILDLQLDQRAGQLCRISQLLCEFIGLEFVSSAEDVHQQLDYCIHRGKSVGEENEADYDGELFVETEGFVEGSVVDEYREEGEDVEEMGLKMLVVVSILDSNTYLRDSKKSSRVSKTPVTKLVCKNSYNFLSLALLNQGIVNDNVLLPWHAEEVGVTVSTSLASVNDI